MNLFRSSKYYHFITITILFLIIVGYSLFIYAGWNDKVDESVSQEELSVEINLPALDWAKYSSLSKQINGGTIERK